MTQFYDNLAATALRLVSAKGKDVTLRQISDTFPAKAYRPVAAATDETVKAIVEDFRATQVDGTTVRSGDRRYVVAASGVTATPTATDRLVDGPEELEVVSVESINPAGTVVMYRLHVRPTGGGS